jgi:threonine dehydrogenase-like Zn-dependent dehydrogenase
VKIEKDKVPEKYLKHFDVIIETAGNPDAMRSALAVAKPAAIIENFAWHHHNHEFDLDSWHLNAWRILNIQPGVNPHFADLFPRTITLMANGVFSNEKLVTHSAKLEDARDIFTIAMERKENYMKGVILF